VAVLVEESVKHRSQRGGRRQLLYFQRYQLGHDAFRRFIEHRDEQTLLGAVVVIDQLLSDARFLRDGFHPRTAKPFAAELVARGS